MWEVAERRTRQRAEGELANRCVWVKKKNPNREAGVLSGGIYKQATTVTAKTTIRQIITLTTLSCSSPLSLLLSVPFVLLVL